MEQKWHTLEINKVIQLLQASPNGLTQKEAENRLKKFGYNELIEKKGPSVLGIFLRQFKSFLILILFIAMLISLFIENELDAIVIGIILILNAILGFVQEYRAEKAIEALKRLTLPRARVIRNGEQIKISIEELVPGDIIILEQGDIIPADSRLIETYSMHVDESILTGESVPVTKKIHTIKDVPLTERKNMIFMGTVITYGRGKAVIVETGMRTEVGKIARILQEEEEITPLQKKLDQFAKWLGLVSLIIVGFVFTLGIFMGLKKTDMIMTALALAVSAVPEGLITVVTITLALGVKKMSKQNALLRRLSAVETLGSTSVICADKTGTMTTNEMTVRNIWCNKDFIEVTGTGFEAVGDFYIHHKAIDPKKDHHLLQLLKISKFCNNAELKKPSILFPNWSIIGDPTEGALLVLAEKAGIEEEYKRIAEIPFSSERKIMTTIYEIPDNKIAYMKGAAETVLNHSNYIFENRRVRKLTMKDREEISSIIHDMAKNGLRVLGLAYKKVRGKIVVEKTEKNLVFVGLVGMIDPPRKEVKEAIEECKTAGIRVVMITGDHKLTAIAIAKELNLIEKEEAITGEELDKMTEKELEDVVEKVSVYARVEPKHKVRILEVLKNKGHVVAMTGDGVNDAPAVKKADIGISMGIKGTDVTREASDMILTDDNFATIIDAVKEGRGVYDNIRKFIRFLLSANFDEIIVTSIAIFAGLPLPLLPLQILWINLITDGLPALALSVDPKEPHIMKRKPRDPKRGIISGMLLFILFASILAVISSLGLFIWEFNSSGNLDKARTMALTGTIMFEFFFIFNCRSERHSVFRMNILSNKKLIYAIILSVILQISIIYIPMFQTIFKTVALNITDWIKIILLSSIGLFVFPEIFMDKEIKFGR